ncbi:vWA domain-containing protein [Streptomyces sp. NRRL B-3229]|uniref:vWA domain-containing protein n=1 Tax=Streptomyces sp. NRRL B-3229 TaxID=1463836 RepID=UPI0004BFC862|nr:VWA domain-containing protein [Streptomyces sp. NRRL B-3229]
MTTDYDIGFASGLDERQPVVILLDASGSMARPVSSPRIAEVDSALRTLFESVRSQARLRARVEICLITFGSRVRVYDADASALVTGEQADPDRVFVPVEKLSPPPLTAEGYTCLEPALDIALRIAAQRLRALEERRLSVLRPLIWMVTDGAPSDERGRALDATELAPLADRLRTAEAARPPDGCVFLTIGVQGADRRLLEVLAPDATFMLEGLDFTQILKFLLRSSDRVSSIGTAGEVHREVARQAALQKAMNELSEKHL